MFPITARKAALLLIGGLAVFSGQLLRDADHSQTANDRPASGLKDAAPNT